MENFKLETDADGIAVITFDVPGKSMNTLTDKALNEIGAMIEQIKADDAIKGVVFASGKASGFCAGADLDELSAALAVAGDDEASQRTLYERLINFNRTFRAVEAWRSAAGLNWPWPATTGSPPTIPSCSSACRNPRSA